MSASVDTAENELDEISQETQLCVCVSTRNGDNDGSVPDQILY